MLIDQGSKEFLNFPLGASGTVETAAKTYIEIMESPALLAEVIRETGLDKATSESGADKWLKHLPAFIHPLIRHLEDTTSDLISVFKYGRVLKSEPAAVAMVDLHNDLSLKTRTDTYSFEIKYTTSDPARAAQVANSVAVALVRFVNALRLSEAGNHLEYLKTELQRKRERLITARERLKSYKETHSFFLPETEYDAKLKVITELQIELAKADAKLVGSRNTLSTVSLAAQRSRFIELLDQRKSELIPLPSLERELKQLEQDVKDASTAYEIVDRSYGEAELKVSYTMPEVRLISEAFPPHVPSSPKRAIISLAALFAGSTIAIGYVLLLEYMNRRLRSAEEVEHFVGLKVLATIPATSLRHRPRGDSHRHKTDFHFETLNPGNRNIM